ncbi:type VI secretion system TssO [Chryseobacterium luquanense]|uniref:Type VI secretion system transmembrane protein TssO n=1 Tax=Chryseobacterium luquanense TaxID=2983766 RepID=A0ABT3Y3T4_9FLAO|nr:type VI secretion system TssO [Chryseobacterium luquanense]MCX8532807.1 type VI secretion system transmembrane protein TssO [Chryseobacterium luquanense]
MSSNREKKLNRSDVRSGIWKFIFSFIILSGISFTSVYFFFKSYDTQLKGIDKEVAQYRDLLNRDDLLHTQVDSIYARMELLDSDKAYNDNYLRTYILDNVREAQQIMGVDSADNFKHYAVLMQKIKPMLNLKSQIINVSFKQQIAIRNVQDCQGKSNQINNKMMIDPTRKFTGRRR